MPVLYISYDGATQPIGQSQVVSYLEGLSRLGHKISLLSFERRGFSTSLSNSCHERLERAGIRWYRLRYHKRPTVAATSFDIASGVLAALRICRRDNIRVLHARSYVPAAICLVVKALTGCKFIFDTRNFWADEKVDAGHWRQDGFLWRVTKSFERRFLLAADHVVTLTERARVEIARLPYLCTPPPISVIPTCVDLALFHPSTDMSRTRDPNVIYTGSLGGRYDDALLGRFFGAVHQLRQNARLAIWSHSDPRTLTEAATAMGVPADRIATRSGTPAQVANAVRAADVGLSFLRDGYSNLSSMPTKIAEYLGSGLAVVTSPGIGDLDDLITTERVGVRLPRYDPNDEELRRAAQETIDLLCDPQLPGRSRRLAERLFALEAGVAKYHSIYRSLLS